MIKRIYLTKWLWQLLLAPLVACATNHDIVFYTGSGVTQDYDLGSTDYYGYFGQYQVSGNSCCGVDGSKAYRRFQGDPEGEIVGRWKVIYLDPTKKDRPYKDQIKQTRYFYVHTRAPISVPSRHKKHSVYEVYIAFGPRNVFPQGLHPQDKSMAKRFYNPSGVEEYVVGDIDTLYYFIRSRPKHIKTSQWPLVSTYPYEFTAVKGIEITHDQYMTIACESVGHNKCNNYLEPHVPGLTAGQKSYIRRRGKDQQ